MLQETMKQVNSDIFELEMCLQNRKDFLRYLGEKVSQLEQLVSNLNSKEKAQEI